MRVMEKPKQILTGVSDDGEVRGRNGHFRRPYVTDILKYPRFLTPEIGRAHYNPEIRAHL